MTETVVWTAEDHAVFASQLLADLAADPPVDQDQRDWTVNVAAAHALTAMALTQTVTRRQLAEALEE